VKTEDVAMEVSEELVEFGVASDETKGYPDGWVYDGGSGYFG